MQSTLLFILLATTYALRLDLKCVQMSYLFEQLLDQKNPCTNHFIIFNWTHHRVYIVALLANLENKTPFTNWKLYMMIIFFNLLFC